MRLAITTAEAGDMKKTTSWRTDLAKGEDGAVGYIAAWLLGVPTTVLFLIFLLRGCN